MNERKFRIIVYTVIGLGLLSVIALVAYAYAIQPDSSIISYIANGR